jgi:hypothetical protein
MKPLGVRQSSSAGERVREWCRTHAISPALTFKEDLQLLQILRDSETCKPWIVVATLFLRFYGLGRAELQYLTRDDVIESTVFIRAKRVLPDVLGLSHPDRRRIR